MQVPQPTIQASYMDAARQYGDPRQPGDVDLVAVVRQMLVEAGLLQQVVAFYDNHHHITEAATKRPEVQRHLLNRYWNLQLLSTPGNSIHARFCLVNNGPIEEWVRLFKTSILPVAVEKNLPLQV